MERTLEHMMADLKFAEEQRKPLAMALNKVDKRIAQLRNEIEAYKRSNNNG